MVVLSSMSYVTLLETMEEWDQDTLEKVVESKRKEYNMNKPTDIVSFLIVSNLCLSFQLSPCLLNKQLQIIRKLQKNFTPLLSDVCRFVSTFWKQWRKNNMVGFGSAPMVVKIAITGMLFPLDIF